MDQFNTFVRKLVLHNKLATEDQIGEAADMVDGSGDSLLDGLTMIGALTEGKARAVANAWQKKTGTMPPGGATKPPAGGSRPAKKTATRQPGARKAASGALATDVSDLNHLEQYFAFARSLGASDLHIIVDNPPQVRINGRLVNLNRADLTADETEKLLFGILSDEQKQIVYEHKSLDFAFTDDDDNRYRCCVAKQRVGYDGAFRIVRDTIPTFEELGLPENLKVLTEYHQGLVLITGPNGCGKSTTLAAMVELCNVNRDDHIVTIEDPVEYVFEGKRCQISQREVGTHTNTFASALRAALREDPDVIMIGELRDHETISLAISAAETGHLVFGTLPTTSAPRTIDRLLDVFPPDEQAQIRTMISESIKGIICQQLVPSKDGKGRVLAMEVLVNTAAVGNIIRERKLHQIESVMQTGKKLGMQLLDNSLEALVEKGRIEGREAWFAAINKKKFEAHAPDLAI